MRKDLHIYNEATGFIITSKGLNGRLGTPFANGTQQWKDEIARGTLIPVSLAQDDSINVRVVLDEDLTEQELEEAWDRFDAFVAVPDGKLVIIGGSEYADEQDDSYINEYGQLLKVPRENYAATLLTYYHSPNALMYPEEDMAAFFRQTRPGKRLPKWITADEYGEHDFVSFVLHLRTVDAIGGNPIPLNDEGWVPETVNVRRPAVCPLGLPTKKLQGKPKPYKQTSLKYRFKVFDSVSTLSMTPVDNGPVSIPASQIILAHWIAFAAGETHPVLRITTNAEWNPGWPGFLNGVQETRTDDGWIIEIEGMNARWTPFRHMRMVGELLASLPDGSRIEANWGGDTLKESGNGMIRFEGGVSGGRWSIEQSYPHLSRETLAGMLAFAEEAEAGKGFLMPDEASRDLFIQHCREHEYFFKKIPPIADGLRVKAEDESLNPFLAAHIFEERFRGVLPIQEWDE